MNTMGMYKAYYVPCPVLDKCKKQYRYVVDYSYFKFAIFVSNSKYLEILRNRLIKTHQCQVYYYSIIKNGHLKSVWNYNLGGIQF